MAKNRNKKKLKNGSAPMDLASDDKLDDAAQESCRGKVQDWHFSPTVSVGGPQRRMKGIQMKKTKNVRKMKAIAKAISKMEQSEEKMSKTESKIQRIKSAKTLYD